MLLSSLLSHAHSHCCLTLTLALISMFLQLAANMCQLLQADVANELKVHALNAASCSPQLAWHDCWLDCPWEALLTRDCELLRVAAKDTLLSFGDSKGDIVVDKAVSAVKSLVVSGRLDACRQGLNVLCELSASSDVDDPNAKISEDSQGKILELLKWGFVHMETAQESPLQEWYICLAH